MNLAIILTAIRLGAKCTNHVSVVNLIKEPNENGKEVVRGAQVRDELTGKGWLWFLFWRIHLPLLSITGKQWTVRAKCVVNATGAFTDTIRQMDYPEAQKLVVPSQGVHIVLPVNIQCVFGYQFCSNPCFQGYYSPKSTGLLDPSTSDGRVIFFLPWEDVTVAGAKVLSLDFVPDVITHYL